MNRIDGVIALTADTDELVARLLQRAQVQGRTDDNEQTIRVRKDVYRKQTEPLLALYRDRDLLVEVDGVGTVEQVADRITDALDRHLSSNASTSTIR